MRASFSLSPPSPTAADGTIVPRGYILLVEKIKHISRSRLKVGLSAPELTAMFCCRAMQLHFYFNVFSGLFEEYQNKRLQLSVRVPLDTWLVARLGCSFHHLQRPAHTCTQTEPHTIKGA